MELCERAVRVSCAGELRRLGGSVRDERRFRTFRRLAPKIDVTRARQSEGALTTEIRSFSSPSESFFLQSTPNPFLIRCDGVTRYSSRTFCRTEGVQTTNIFVFLPQTRESAVNPESACAYPDLKTPNRSQKLHADGALRLQEPLAFFACFCSLCCVRNTAATMLEILTCAYAKGHQSVSADRAKSRPKRAPNATQRAKSSSSGGFTR